MVSLFALLAEVVYNRSCLKRQQPEVLFFVQLNSLLGVEIVCIHNLLKGNISVCVCVCVWLSRWWRDLMLCLQSSDNVRSYECE